MPARQAITARDVFRTTFIAGCIVALGAFAASPAAAAGKRGCLVGASPAQQLDAGQRQEASNRVLSLVARNLGAFTVDIVFEGPLESNALDRQIEIMKSVAAELELPGAPEAE
ncbi:MAG: hypothetical protein JNK84_00540 [Phreatobacter sp.]|uniref:hypothetical protein n=1 Tax=Phreatobacter sp. TaxID=1966341 RepID=UPI001A3A1597|nr:hypothetical protein [Phreatobacter sp.]MBL8567548.1 hypothetical protein [Phreatobacter sp.]